MIASRRTEEEIEMKHKVKLVSVHEDIITLKVDGVLCSYLVQRPQPLSPADARMLQTVMNNRLFESLSMTTMRPRCRLVQRFSDLWRASWLY